MLDAFVVSTSGLRERRQPSQQRDLVSLFILDEHRDLSRRGHDKTIIGYYASWQWYDRNGLASPANMDFTKITRANFAFFQITEGGDIYGTDAWADAVTLFGPYDVSLCSRAIIRSDVSSSSSGLIFLALLDSGWRRGTATATCTARGTSRGCRRRAPRTSTRRA